MDIAKFEGYIQEAKKEERYLGIFNINPGEYRELVDYMDKSDSYTKFTRGFYVYEDGHIRISMDPPVLLIHTKDVL